MKIEVFLAKFPGQVAKDFTTILNLYRDGRMAEIEVRRLMQEKIDMGINMVKPHREKSDFEKEMKKHFRRRTNGIGGTKYWNERLEKE